MCGVVGPQDSDEDDTGPKKRKVDGALANDEVVSKVKKGVWARCLEKHVLCWWIVVLMIKGMATDTKTALAGLIKPKAKTNSLNVGIAPKAAANNGGPASNVAPRPTAAAGAGVALLGAYGDSSGSGSE
jgi:hypothetical protein